MNDQIEKIASCLEEINEPDTGFSIIKLKMVRDLRIVKDQLHFSIVLASPNYTHKAFLHEAINTKISSLFPELQIHVHFINQAAYADIPNTLLPQIRNFIAIASGKGGVGKSTVSVNLALALKHAGFKVGILDADLYGPSIPTILGIKDKKPKVMEVDGKPKMIPIELSGMAVVSLGNIIEPDQAVVLRGPRLAAIIKQFFYDTVWPELDYLVVDLPPGTGDVQLTLVQTIPITGVVMVTTPQEVAYVDAVKAANMFELDQIRVPILGVIENMSWFEPDDQPEKKYYIFGEGAGDRLAKKTNSSLLGQVPLRTSLRAAFDEGNALNLDPYYLNIFLKITDQLNQKIKLRHMIYAPSQVVNAN
jgi:ATP-binding protein involved in chromosome partitioning